MPYSEPGAISAVHMTLPGLESFALHGKAKADRGESGGAMLKKKIALWAFMA